MISTAKKKSRHEQVGMHFTQFQYKLEVAFEH